MIVLVEERSHCLDYRIAMVQDYSIDFTDYLRSICGVYEQWWKLDKLTETIYMQQDASGNPRSPFQFNNP
ncbi:hypothetical protein [Coleofasciculus sp. E1-EBD-02]|uniref:hypothetical protein n=1 Tax=Coleofasciculus sp. E1-EBD-02 TaxID=3068481 RepID=UPI00330183EC